MQSLNSQIKHSEFTIILLFCLLISALASQLISQKCQLNYQVTPADPVTSTQGAQEIASFETEVDLSNSNFELSLFLRFRFSESDSSFLNLADLAVFVNQNILQNYLKMQVNLNNNSLNIFYRKENDEVGQASVSVDQLESEQAYYMGLAVDFTQKIAHVFLMKDDSVQGSTQERYLVSNLDTDIFDTNSKENANILVNETLSMPSLFWQANQSSGSINTVLGCVQPPNDSKVFCSNIEFDSFAIINQYFSELEFLPLISTDRDSYAEFYLFGTSASPSKIPATNSFGTFKDLTLESTAILKVPSNNDISFQNDIKQYSKYSVQSLQLPKTIGFTFEVGFGQWNSTKGIMSRDATNSSKREVTLLDIQNQDGISQLRLKMVETSEVDRDLPSDDILETISLEIDVNNEPISLSQSVLLSALKESSPSVDTIQKNQKFSLYIDQTNTSGMKIFLFKINSQSRTGENLISNLAHYSSASSRIPLSSARLELLSDFANRLDDFDLSRFMISDNLGGIFSYKLASRLSSVSDECRMGCLLGQFMLQKPLFESDVFGRDFQRQMDPQICWACRGLTVFQSNSGSCKEYCGLSTYNLNGNCVPCAMEDCSGVGQKLNYALELEREGDFSNLKLTPSIKYLNFEDKIYENNFDVFESVNGGSFERKPFSLSIDNASQAGIFKVDSSLGSDLIKGTSSSDFSRVLQNSGTSDLTYRVQLKPSSRIIDQNRNLVYSDPLLASTSNTAFSAPVVAPVANVMNIPGNVTTAHSNLLVDKKYASCFSFFSDKVLNNFAIAFYVFYVILFILFILYVILLWNKVAPWRFDSAVTHLFVSSACMFQGIVFCVFYEIDMPPTLDLFLRHLYRVSTHWHGAFRNEALRNHEANPDFNFNFFRVVRQKPYDLDVVQNIFINFGVILLILVVLWVVSAVLYFIFLRIKPAPARDSTAFPGPADQTPDSKPTQTQKFEPAPMLKLSMDNPTFLQMLSLSFAFLLATAITLAFTVELIFYCVFEFYKASPRHSLFQASLAFAILFFICLLALILWVLFTPFALLKDINKQRPVKPSPNSKNYKHELQVYESTLIIFDQFHSDISFLDLSRLREKYAPFQWLFVVQGLKLKLLRPYFLGITAFLYFLYAMFLVVLSTPAHLAVIVNFVIVSLLLVQTFFFPFVNFLENIFLLVGHLFFWIGYFLLLLLSVSAFSTNNLCHMGLAIAALMFLGWLVLMFGVIYAMVRLCLFFAKIGSKYQASPVTGEAEDKNSKKGNKGEQTKRENMRNEDHFQTFQVNGENVRNEENKDTRKEKKNKFRDKIKSKTFSEDIDKSFKSGIASNQRRGEQSGHRHEDDKNVRVNKNALLMDSGVRPDQTTDRGTTMLMPDVQSEEVTQEGKIGLSPDLPIFETFQQKNEHEFMVSENKNLLEDKERHRIKKTREQEISKEKRRRRRQSRGKEKLTKRIEEIREEIEERKSHFDQEETPHSELDYKMRNVQQLSGTRRKSRNKFHERYRKSRKFRDQEQGFSRHLVDTRPLKIESDTSKALNYISKEGSRSARRDLRRAPEEDLQGQFQFGEVQTRITQRNRRGANEDQVLKIDRLEEELENPFELEDSTEREIVFRNQSNEFEKANRVVMEQEYYVKEKHASRRY